MSVQSATYGDSTVDRSTRDASVISVLSGVVSGSNGDNCASSSGSGSGSGSNVDKNNISAIHSSNQHPHPSTTTSPTTTGSISISQPDSHTHTGTDTDKITPDDTVIGRCVDCSCPYDHFSGLVVCTVCRLPVLVCGVCVAERCHPGEFHCFRHR